MVFNEERREITMKNSKLEKLRKEERRKRYESMKKEIEYPYSWVLNDFNDIWIKHYKELKEEFEND